MNKRQLAVLLSGLNQLEKKDVKLEQYPTDSEIAAEVAWNAYMSADIEDKTIADLGCGNGILGIAALVLGAKKVIFLDIDKKSVELTKNNVNEMQKRLGKKLKAEFICSDIKAFKGKIDTVIQNPPFGTKQEHADKEFLLKAMQTAKTIYSFHKASTESFVKAIIKDNGFEAKAKWRYKFPLKHSFSFHKKKVAYADVLVWKLEKA
ncbi:MAG: METTL5 family protein [Nanoarchaeota archaeon]|nr:METTL5 family protein [Nanoarchaeota archaeon]